MGQFLFEYSMFAVKAVTIVLCFAAIIALLARGKLKNHTNIEVEKLNDKYNNLKTTIENKILNKKQRKAAAKKLKQYKNKSHDKRLFVINFKGDVKATSAIQSLREAITALLNVANPTDEVLVTVESAGGLVHSYGLAAAQLTRIKDRNIRLTVAIDLVAASGGYLMATVADHIIAAPFAIVGSIGVVAQLPNFNKLLNKHDIEIEQHTAGKHKRTLTMLGKNTDEQRDKFKEELEQTHLLFKQFVTKYRPQLDIEKIATGEHWFGTQALELKLVDQLSTSDDYLLNKSTNNDIFAIKVTVKEKLADKLSAILFRLRANI